MRISTMRSVLSWPGRVGVSRRTGYVAAALLAAGSVAVLAAPTGQAAGAVPGDAEGIMCEQPASAAAPSFALEARSGYVGTPDGNALYMWSYTATGRSFQLPGPTLCVDSGVTVTVTLRNTLREPTSIVFSGQSDLTADAKPAGPVFDSAGKLTSLVPAAPASGGAVTYRFTAGSPGTYLYSSGTDVAKQREMGLYGALVVRPVGAAKQANADRNSAFSKEFLYLVSSVDPNLHAAVELGRSYDFTNIVARYFFINGRSMPDTLAPNNAAWLPAQPYGALLHISADPARGAPRHPPALVRYLDAGRVNYPFHPHGSSQTVVNRDGAPTHDATGGDASYGKFLLDVGPGQSIDSLENWKQEYDPSANKIPADIQLPQLQDQIVGPGTETWFSENLYLGGAKGDVPTGIVQNNVCGEYYHVAHSHALYQATNYGASFGGMMTLIRVDPPGNFDCAGTDYQ